MTYFIMGSLWFVFFFGVASNRGFKISGWQIMVMIVTPVVGIVEMHLIDIGYPDLRRLYEAGAFTVIYLLLAKQPKR